MGDIYYTDAVGLKAYKIIGDKVQIIELKANGPRYDLGLHLD